MNTVNPVVSEVSVAPCSSQSLEKMRSLVAGVLFGVVVVLLTQSILGDAISVVQPRDIAVARFRLASAISLTARARERRQVTPSCITVVTNYSQNPNFLVCQREFEKLGNASSFTNDDVAQFCNHHCATLLDEAINAIKKACGTDTIPVGEVSIRNG